MTNRNRTRSGFTVTELLVATALTLAIMVLIAQVYQRSLETFSKLRTAGVMQEKLGVATSLLRRDLGAEHFEGPFQPGFSGPYVGDQRLDRQGWLPPHGGFFQVRQQNMASMEGTERDGEGLNSTRATDHMLHFMVKLPSAQAGELFVANMPFVLTTTGPMYPGASPQVNAFANPATPTDPINQLMYSQWAEVCYFLTATGDFTDEKNPIVPLYTLRRRERLLAPTTIHIAATPPSAISLAGPGGSIQITLTGTGAAGGSFAGNTFTAIATTDEHVADFATACGAKGLKSFSFTGVNGPSTIHD